MFSVVIDR